MEEIKTDQEYIEEFYSIFKSTKFEASYSRIKEVDGKSEPYFVEDWLLAVLAQKNKEIDLAVSKERERAIDKIKHHFNGYGGSLGFTKNELINLINTK